VAERLNRLLAPLRPSMMTTLAYLVLDPDTESVRMLSAGHLPPLVVDPAGSARYLSVEGDPPLGVARGAAYREQAFSLPTGSTLVLVTDGAVEVRGEPLDDGLERLRTLAERERNLERLCSAIVRGEVTRQRPEDDVAVLAARITPLPDRLRASLPAEPERLSGMRHLLGRWMKLWHVRPDEAYDITVAVQEACANAVEHAYAPGPAAFEVEASYDEGVITVAIRDRGRWREARGRHRGRGLPLMEALMDSVGVQREEHGTTIVMRRALGREAAA
jgi:anti-sigma regulatory factor (Ser/Thr protein kinase)